MNDEQLKEQTNNEIVEANEESAKNPPKRKNKKARQEISLNGYSLAYSVLPLQSLASDRLWVWPMQKSIMVNKLDSVMAHFMS